MRENRTYGLEGGEPDCPASLPLSLVDERGPSLVGFLPNLSESLAQPQKNQLPSFEPLFASKSPVFLLFFRLDGDPWFGTRC